MKHKYIICLSIICVFLLLNCTTKENPTEITVSEVQKIEDTIPGWFIKSMGLNYSSGKPVTILMHEHLAKLGTPIDKFKDENGNLHIIWEYYDIGGVINKFRKSNQGLNPIVWYFSRMNDNIILEEKLTTDGFTFTFRYPPPGIPWNKLVTLGTKGLSMDRKNMVVIKAKSDKYTRIFLYGQGNFCTEIVVL